MKLRSKFLKWNAGLPVAMLNKETAIELGVKAQEMILIKTLSKHPKEMTAVLDIIDGEFGKKQILLSLEVKSKMNLKKGQIVDINIAPIPRSVDLIRKKLNNKRLSRKEIDEIIKDIVNDRLSEPEIALFVAAMYRSGMTNKETIYLINAILKTGERFSVKDKFVVDKHSIGGVAGNRTTPIVVPICAAAGLKFPKTSSRAITSAAGTADVMEAICKVNLTKEEIEKIVRKTNACMVWGGALGFAPADDKIIRVENLISIDPEPNLIASILAKKLSVGSKYVLIDIPYGKYAKVNKKQAIKLKNKFETIGKRFNLKIKCVIPTGSQPIGHGIGPIPELRDIISILKNQPEHPKDLRKKAVFLAGEILELCNKAKKGKGYKMAEEVLVSGKAFDKFKEIVEAQKGNLSKNKLMLAKFSHIIYSEKNAKIVDIDNKRINLLARVAGSPNDKKAGLYLWKHLGEKIKKGEEILTIYSSSDKKLKDAVDFYKKNKVIIVR